MVKEVLKMDNVVSKIADNINAAKETDDYQFNFNIHEVSALVEVAFEVYNSFVDHEEKGAVFSSEVNQFLDNLDSALTKLNK